MIKMPRSKASVEHEALEVVKDTRKDFDYSSDPLDFETPGSVISLAQTRVLRDYTITTDSYISLCSRVYAAYCFENADFALNISESAFQYYAVILLWLRIAQILPSSAKTGSQFFRHLTTFHVITNNIPPPLATYLKGIGSFRDPDGSDRQFSLPVFPNNEEISGVPYTFGKVSAETHHFYEAFPAPEITALRVMADIRYTEDACEENLLWDLPKQLRPDIQELHMVPLKPTKNLLGWAPAQLLTDKQLATLDCLKTKNGSTHDNFSSLTDSLYPLFNKIIGLMHSYCRGISRQYISTNSIGCSSTGSVVQGMTTEKHSEFSKFDKSTMYCEGNISVSSSYPANSSLIKGAVISGYRMAKEPISNRHCWACYDFNEYKSVPKSWILSRNTIYTYGSIGRWNETLYTSGYINKRILQNECIKHSMLVYLKNWNIYN